MRGVERPGRQQGCKIERDTKTHNTNPQHTKTQNHPRLFPPQNARTCTHAHDHTHSEEVSKARLNRMRGVEHHDRVDEELYHDFESDEARRRRLLKEQKEQQRLDKLASKKGEAAAAAERKASEARRAKEGAARGNLFYKVTVRVRVCDCD